MHTILFCHAVVFNGICFDGFLEKYSGTHEDDEKIAKIRDVTLNHRNTFTTQNGHRKPALSDSRAALVATKRGSDKR